MVAGSGVNLMLSITVWRSVPPDVPPVKVRRKTASVLLKMIEGTAKVMIWNPCPDVIVCEPSGVNGPPVPVVL